MKNTCYVLVLLLLMFPSCLFAECIAKDVGDHIEVVCSDPSYAMKSEYEKEIERKEMEAVQLREYRSAEKNRREEELRQKCIALEERVLVQQFVDPAYAVLAQYKSVCGGKNYHSQSEMETLCDKLERRMNKEQSVNSLKLSADIYNNMCRKMQ